MKRNILFLAVLGLMFSICGCRTVEFSRLPPSIWPAKSPNVSLYYVPQKLASVEEAMGNIKNLQQNFVEWAAGFPLTALEVDAYGMRAKWNWTETRQQTTAVPTYGGMFVGWHYVPTYSTTFQTQTFAQPKSDMFIIPFNEVRGFNLTYMPFLAMDFKWGLIVVLNSGKVVYLRVSDEAYLHKLADSIATLAMARGMNFTQFWFGCTVGSVNAAQSERLGLAPDTGILVVDIARGSCAEKAGIQFLDVILEFDNSPCNKPDDMVGAVNRAYAAGKKSVPVKLVRLVKVSRQIEDPRSKKILTELVEQKTEEVIQAALNY
jgi:membrane-associated protease RseP (regulator of RpoE activity)